MFRIFNLRYYQNHRTIVNIVQLSQLVFHVRIRGFYKTGAQFYEELKAYHQTRHLALMLMSAERDLLVLAGNLGRMRVYAFDINQLLLKVNELIKQR